MTELVYSFIAEGGGEWENDGWGSRGVKKGVNRWGEPEEKTNR